MQSIQEAVDPEYQPMGTCRRLLTHVPTRPVPGTQGTSEFENFPVLLCQGIPVAVTSKHLH